MILFGLFRSMVECFFPTCYDFFLFWFLLRTRTIGRWTLDFRFVSFPFLFLSCYHFCFDFPRREATHLWLTIDFYPFWDRLITRSLPLVRRVFPLPIVASVVRNTNRGKSWPPRCGIPYTTRSFFLSPFFWYYADEFLLCFLFFSRNRCNPGDFLVHSKATIFSFFSFLADGMFGIIWRKSWPPRFDTRQIVRFFIVSFSE